MKLRRVPNFLMILIIALVLFNFNALSRADSSIDIDLLVAKLEPAIQRMMLEGKIPSATIALVHEDRTIWTGAFGFSNLWSHTPAVPNTVYLIGSTFKAMSMFALLQQMEEGKFRLDDRVNYYLDDFKIQGENPRKPVTFRHLLTHVSGLPGDFGPHAVWGDTVPPSLKDYLSKSLKLQHQPMTKVVYSNMGYTLVAYLVERFAKVPYRKYIQEHIFDPLEMKDTAFAPRPDMEERLAIPYVVDEKTGSLVPTIRLKANVWPAGIVYGTVTNQANWLIANLNRGVFKNHRLISENTFKQVMRRQYNQFNGPVSAGWLNASTGYGLTWWISHRKGDIYFAHSGSVPGYTAFIVGNLDQKTGIAILTNGNKAHKHLYDLALKALDLMKAYKK